MACRWSWITRSYVCRPGRRGQDRGDAVVWARGHRGCQQFPSARRSAAPEDQPRLSPALQSGQRACTRRACPPQRGLSRAGARRRPGNGRRAEFGRRQPAGRPSRRAGRRSSARVGCRAARRRPRARVVVDVQDHVKPDHPLSRSATCRLSDREPGVTSSQHPGTLSSPVRRLGDVRRASSSFHVPRARRLKRRLSWASRSRGRGRRDVRLGGG